MHKYGAEFLGTFWLFWVAPIIGGVLGAVIYRFIGREES
jgi:aquaporin Z